MYQVPDPQHLMLDALYEVVDKMHENGAIDDESLQYHYDNEPESVVFSAEHLDEAYAGDSDEAREVVNAVGERDLDSKIRYWRGVIADVNDSFVKEGS